MPSVGTPASPPISATTGKNASEAPFLAFSNILGAPASSALGVVLGVLPVLAQQLSSTPQPTTWEAWAGLAAGIFATLSRA